MLHLKQNREIWCDSGAWKVQGRKMWCRKNGWMWELWEIDLDSWTNWELVRASTTQLKLSEKHSYICLALGKPALVINRANWPELRQSIRNKRIVYGCCCFNNRKISFLLSKVANLAALYLFESRATCHLEKARQSFNQLQSILTYCSFDETSHCRGKVAKHGKGQDMYWLW